MPSGNRRWSKRFARRAALRSAVAGMGAAAALKVTGRLAGQPVPTAAAAAGAAAAATALELPAAAPLLGVAALAVTAREVRRGQPPAAAGAALAAGSVAAVLTRSMWPVAPTTGGGPRTKTAVPAPPAGGAGLAVVVNSDAGPALSRTPTEVIDEALPEAAVFEVAEGDDLVAVLRRAADGAKALGVAGGDGSVNAGAAVALDRGLPLMVVPAGTLNHLARDLGIHTFDDAVETVRRGDAVSMDVGEYALDDGSTRIFLNTASFGSYPELVDAREKLEGTIGKWPALMVALLRVLRGSSPLDIEVNGKRRKVWMVFVGNCRYHPSGFAPSWRDRLDDGRFDVRLVDGTQPWARLRLALAVLSGTLHRSKVYEQFECDRLSVRSGDGPLRLARDGETFDGTQSFEIRKHRERLTVYASMSDESAQ